MHTAPSCLCGPAGPSMDHGINSVHWVDELLNKFINYSSSDFVLATQIKAGRFNRDESHFHNTSLFDRNIRLFACAVHPQNKCKIEKKQHTFTLVENKLQYFRNEVCKLHDA